MRALPISRYLEMPRETVRRHMGRLVTLGLFERAEDRAFVPSKELLELRSIGRCDCFARELRDYCEAAAGVLAGNATEVGACG